MTAGAPPESEALYRADELAWVQAGKRLLAINRDRPGWAVLNDPAAELVRCVGQEWQPASQIHSSYAEAVDNPPLQDTIEGLEALADANLLWRAGAPEGDDPSDEPVAYSVEHLYIELLARCNLQCVHCYMGGSPHRTELLESQEVIDLLQEFKAYGGEFVTLSGGEPLIYRSFEQVARELAALGLKGTVITNGTVMRRHHAELLLDTGFQVAISLDGASAETNDPIRGKRAFEKAIRAIDLAVEVMGPESVILSMTPNRMNLRDLPKIFQLADARKIPRLNLSLVEPVGRGSDNWGELGMSEEESQHFIETVFECALEFAGRIEVDFNDTRNVLDVFSTNRALVERHPLWRGVRVDSCGQCYPSTFGAAPEFLLGNIRSASLESILSSPVLIDLHRTLVDRFQAIPKCSSCSWGQLCRGGGVTSSYYMTGSLFSPDTYCSGYLNAFPKIACALADYEGSGE